MSFVVLKGRVETVVLDEWDGPMEVGWMSGSVVQVSDVRSPSRPAFSEQCIASDTASSLYSPPIRSLQVYCIHVVPVKTVLGWGARLGQPGGDRIQYLRLRCR